MVGSQVHSLMQFFPLFTGTRPGRLQVLPPKCTRSIWAFFPFPSQKCWGPDPHWLRGQQRPLAAVTGALSPPGTLQHLLFSPLPLSRRQPQWFGEEQGWGLGTPGTLGQSPNIAHPLSALWGCCVQGCSHAQDVPRGAHPCRGMLCRACGCCSIAGASTHPRQRGARVGVPWLEPEQCQRAAFRLSH